MRAEPNLLVEAENFYADWLAPWAWLVPPDASPLFLNRFGCWFLKRADGGVHLLDVFYGQLERLAGDEVSFRDMTNDPAWREVYLFSKTVASLHAAGVVAAGNDCYAIAPHPAVGGPDPWAEPVAPAVVMVMDMGAWQSLCAEFVRIARQADPA